VQRLTRYPLLISQIERYTEPDVGDAEALHSALRMSESILNKTNEAIRERETRERLHAISEDLWVGKAAVSSVHRDSAPGLSD